MFSFVLSLLVLTVMFSLISGAAFLLRRTLLRGREGMMYPFWVLILLISIIPLKFDVPSIAMPAPIPAGTAPEHSEAVYTGDFSEIARAEAIYRGDSPQTMVMEFEHQPPMEAHIRRGLATIGHYADTIAAVAFILWLSGAVFHFTSSMMTYVNTRYIMRVNSSHCTDERLLRLLAECRRTIGLRRRVELRVFDLDCLCSPCVCGLMRPALYLEPGCFAMSDKELSCVLMHELTHIKRCDIAIKLFCLFATAVHWLNPTARKVKRALFDDCELACDYSVIDAYGREISGLYMRTILDFAERFSENSRLVGQRGLGGGLFISQPSGAAFLKRRFANMKNFRKDRLANVITGAFTLICAAANVLALSSCSGITPGSLSAAIDLTPPMEQMVRAHYGLSNDDFITPEMLDGITSLTIKRQDAYENHILVGFDVNGDEYGTNNAQALPLKVHANYYESVILPAVQDYTDSANSAYLAAGKVATCVDVQKILAFYQKKDPNDPELTERAYREMLLTFPELENGEPIYLFDIFATERERNAIYQILDRAGLVDPWELESDLFDCSSLAYFSNLTEIEFVGLTPVGYDFPETVKVTYENAPMYEIVPLDAFDAYIIEPEIYEYALPADGAEVAELDNESLTFALREYFIMSSRDMESLPLTTAHLSGICSIKAEYDDEMTKLLRKADAGGALQNAAYIRYTINGKELDVIPQYLNDADFDAFVQSVEAHDAEAGALIEKSYSFNSYTGLWRLNDDTAKEDKIRIFTANATIALNKAALVGKTEAGAYITQFQSASSRVGGLPARLLDSAELFDAAVQEQFPNLTSFTDRIS